VRLGIEGVAKKLCDKYVDSCVINGGDPGNVSLVLSDINNVIFLNVLCFNEAYFKTFYRHVCS
jgi:hypothetical protein